MSRHCVAVASGTVLVHSAAESGSGGLPDNPDFYQAPSPALNPQRGDVMRRRWTITTHATGRPRDVDVILYDKLGHMRAAASRHSNTWEPDNIGFDNAEGVCHGFQLFEIHDDGTEEEQQRTAILRFTRGHVSPEIVSHEVAHAAQHLYGLDCIETGTAKDHFDSGNETFAHLLGDLFATVWTLTQEEP